MKRSSDQIDDNETEENEREKKRNESSTMVALPQHQQSQSIEPAMMTRRKCPYLDTICRQLLDFDQLKVCSVTLTNRNVYACLVCGKFFQGRSKSTPAYTHSVQFGHFVFINLHDCRAFCLPDGYEVIDQSLDDVKKCLSPNYTTEEIELLNRNASLARDVYGISYLPGFVGLNNLKHTDHVNVVLHALSHVTPLRNFFLDPKNTTAISRSPLCEQFGGVMRKLWSKHNFKSVISPVEFLEEIATASKRRFDVGNPAEVIDFLVWLLSELHRGLGGTNKIQTVANESFQGFITVTTRRKSDTRQSVREGEEGDSGRSDTSTGEEWVESTISTPFTYLALDIPPTPLFRDSTGGLIIPQVPLFELLRKYDGKTWIDALDSEGRPIQKRYQIKRLPKYLIFHLVRFVKNNFATEKNVTIVTFPVKNLELKDYVTMNGDDAGGLAGSTKFDLLANICHESSESKDLVMVGPAAASGTKASVKAAGNGNSASAGSYRCHVQSKSTGQWFEIQDLHVKETMPQLIGLSESYLLVYENKSIH